MKRGEDEFFDFGALIACLLTTAIIVFGLLGLAVRLYEVQVTDAAHYGYAGARQSERRVQTAGLRGRILDRHLTPLAENRSSVSIVCNPSAFQAASFERTVQAISQAVERVGKEISRPVPRLAIARHVRQALALPLEIWRDVGERELAILSERAEEFPGFEAVSTMERIYPNGTLASHLLGYVGRDRGDSVAGDEKINFYAPEMKGRAGIEMYYDSYLRGGHGEKRVTVDARGFAVGERTIVEPQEGPDLLLSIDAGIQAAVEHELAGQRGACAVIDPRNGDVLALASAPGYNPNDFVPSLDPALYRKFATDPAKPLLNRASGGAYAPGSTFKPITALAALSNGRSATREVDCRGLFLFGQMKLHCASRWGHGPLDLRHALMKSCNPYFCTLAVENGTNAIVRAAKEFGLGMKTGIDLGVDMAGTIPDADWKMRMYGEKWYAADLIQMSIGQGMLLVSPLQMARVAGAIGTGYLVTPRLKRDIEVKKTPLKFSVDHLNIIRDGMRMVVNGDGQERGTGWRAGAEVGVKVCGKTGTAEIGRGENRRKNTWFIAYAPADDPSVAIAMVIENGESGGSTTAPRVGSVLKAIFNDR